MLTCLIAEDEAITGMALAEAVEEAGYQVLGPFSRCSEIFQALAQATPDVVILDVKLKDGPSVEVAEYLCDRGIPYVVYSGHQQTRDMHPAFAKAHWIEKPASPHTILAAAAARIGTARETIAPQIQNPLSIVHFAHTPRPLPSRYRKT